MPLYLDRHYLAGLSKEQVIAAHELDLAIQDNYNAQFLTYWFDEGRHTTFCLVMAPSADMISAIHSKTHGSIPNDVAEVDQSEILSFMGRIADIPAGERTGSLPVDRATRTIMFIDLVGYTSMMSRLGDDRAFVLLREHDSVIRDALTKFGGREVKHTGDGVMASFDQADQAVRAAVGIRSGIANISVPDLDEGLGIRIGMTSGEPLQEGKDLFGSVVNLASRLCDLAEANEILLTSDCQEELTDGLFVLESMGEVTIRGFDNPIHVSRVKS
ncbi:MAG: DUF4242 domain-containing protein [Chloroflexi bacterium]|nr:DUF4242 domain-containing protein [Chloroflexota bacterium]